MKQISLVMVIAMLCAIAIPSVIAQEESFDIQNIIYGPAATVPNAKITKAWVSTTAFGNPVTSFKQGQDIYLSVSYTLSATADDMVVYSNPSWPVTVASSYYSTTKADTAGSHSWSAGPFKTASVPTGKHTAILETVVANGNMQFQTVSYTINK